MKLEKLYKLVHSLGYIFSQGEWKKGNSKKNHLEIAELLIDKVEEYTSKYELAVRVDNLSEEWDDLHASKSLELNQEAKEFEQKYLKLIDKSSKFCDVPTINGKPRENVDTLIWGTPLIAKRGDGSTYIVVPTSDKNEYREVATDFTDFRDEFAPSQILVNGNWIPRVVFFEKVLTAIRNKFPETNLEPATLEDLDFRALSPTMLSSFLDVSANLNKEKSMVTGFRIEYKKSYTLSDYYRDSVDFMLGSAKVIDNIVPLSNDTSVPSFKYVDLEAFDKAEGKYPAWQNFMDTFKEPESKQVFMAWIYSILDAKNKSPQLLWLSSQGGTGKSSMVNALTDMLGECVGTISDKDISSDFGMETVIGKRLVINADNKKPAILHTEVIHNLTTGDIVTVNRKNKTKFSARLYVKLLVCSNVKPNLNTDENNQNRRIIYIEQNTPTEDQLIKEGRLKIVDGIKISYDNADEFKERLKAEFPAFIKEAKKHYDRLCPARGSVAIPESLNNLMKEELNATENNEIIDFINNNYEVKSSLDLPENESFVQSKDFKEDFRNESEEFQRLVKNGWHRVEGILKNKYGMSFSNVYRPKGKEPSRKGICGKDSIGNMVGLVKKQNNSTFI